MARRDLVVGGDSFQRNVGMRFDFLRRQPGLAEHQGERHREAAGMRGAEQFFRIGTFAVLEARLESIRRRPEDARFGGNGAATVLDAALPDCPCLLDQDCSASGCAARD